MAGIDGWPSSRFGRSIGVATVSNCLLMCFGLVSLAASEPSEQFAVWPDGKMVGSSRVNADEPERLVTERRRTFDQWTNISVPTVAVFLPPKDKRTGAAVLVCPGGGMQRLAYEHEGVEIADWLNPLGISVFVLKYRVPGPSSTALLDTQRAMGIIRSRADDFQIDPQRLAVMGFSAGAEVALLLATQHQQRGYPPIDQADDFSCRPTSACLVYPGGIVGRDGQLRPEIASNLSAESTPPMFLVHAFADSSLNSLALAIELKRKQIPSELHIYQEGGHGFGARDSGLPLNDWKSSFQKWIDGQGFFDPAFVAQVAAELVDNIDGNLPLPTVSQLYPQATLRNAYAIQNAFVRVQRQTDPIVGFKAGYVTKASQESMGLPGPATGVLFQSGRMEYQAPVELSQADLGASVIETELGFVVSNGLDISTHVSTEKQIKGAFEGIVPVIELPQSLQVRMGESLQAVDIVAANIGARRFMVHDRVTSPDVYQPQDLKITLTKDGKELHRVVGDTIDAGLWQHLIRVVNQIVDQGYTLRSGDIVIAGALGKVHVAEPGSYTANYGQLGQFEFRIK